MAKRKSYTDNFRAGAVLQWEATPNYVQVAKNLKIPEATLRSWVNKAGKNGHGKKPAHSAIDVEVYDMKKDDFEKSVIRLLGLHVNQAENTLDEASHHEVIGGIKILFDTYQLLTGGATANENQQVLIKYAD